jgi:hypothetical protein
MNTKGSHGFHGYPLLIEVVEPQSQVTEFM